MLAGTHIFQPLAFESHGPQNASEISFISDLGHRISQQSGDARFNAVIFGESLLAAPDDADM